MVECSDNRRYSWQVAPQQSPLPLHTGVAKIIELKKVTRSKCTKNVKNNIQKMQRKKETKKEIIGMGYRP